VHSLAKRDLSLLMRVEVKENERMRVSRVSYDFLLFALYHFSTKNKGLFARKNMV
jgi:hypothetical protein